MNVDTQHSLCELPMGFPPMKYLSNIRLSTFLNSECEAMNRLVGVVNKLQDVVMMLGQEGFKFPQIVVVGDQSSGKSSVLEGLVGRSFLPRGVGTVTRRPLLVRLESMGVGKEKGEIGRPIDKVVFQHVDKIFTDFGSVMKEIEDETDRVAGSNNAICSEPIVMTLYSTHATSNLTLVDLPGIVKVPVGDQPPDIETTVRELILAYISNPNSIILAVVTANTDIATNESLKIAREVDPEGERTLAVVTKLDLMDPGTNASNILNGNVISVKLGIIGVVNRSQRDIIQGKSQKEATSEEMAFFSRNYPQIAHKHGRSYLAKRLQNLLIEHVKKYLPQLRNKIQVALAIQTKHLKNLQGPDMKSPNQSLLQILTDFATSYIAQLRGQNSELDTNELKGGARISYVFHEVFGVALSSINPLEGYSKSSILTAVRNSAGAKPCMFVPEGCFELLLKKQISRLEAPALRCVQLVYDEMERILYTCLNHSNLEVLRFPKLAQKLVDVSLSLLRSRIAETESLVQNLIAIQGAYINTAHPDFKRNDCAYDSTGNQIVPVNEENSDIPLVSMIEKLMTKYFCIVKKEVQDMVPKAIMYCFVNYIIEHLHSVLVSNLYGSVAQNQEFLEESITIVEKKKNTARMIDALDKANKVILEINEGNFIF